MSLPKVVNGTVGFGNDALPVKPFNTPLAKTTRLASVRALKPMTARIGLTFVFETLIGISFCSTSSLDLRSSGALHLRIDGTSSVKLGRARRLMFRAAALTLRARLRFAQISCLSKMDIDGG